MRVRVPPNERDPAIMPVDRTRQAWSYLPMDEVAACPACGIDVPTPEGVVVGEILVCAHCGAEIEVISLAPILLEFFEEEEK